MAQKLIDMKGERYGRLVVVCRADFNSPQNKPLWTCKCDCGNYTSVTRRNLIKGYTISCGCYRRELSKVSHTTHGLSKTNSVHNRLYRIWSGIKDRCGNPKSKYWSKYGERGILVCDEWINDYQVFHDWSMANGYNDSLTLDRIDNNKGYEPLNCRWVDYAVQENNRTNNICFLIDNKKYTLSQLARKDGITRKQAERKYKENRIYGK